AEALHRHRDRNDHVAAVIDAHHAGILAIQGVRHLGITLPVAGAELAIKRQIAATEPSPHGNEGAFEQSRPFGVGRRQVEAQYVAAAEQIAAVDQEHAVAVIDARARLSWRYKAA